MGAGKAWHAHFDAREREREREREKRERDAPFTACFEYPPLLKSVLNQ
jgi:hypothetical protein